MTEFARDHNFDPTCAGHWYSVSAPELRSWKVVHHVTEAILILLIKGGYQVLENYDSLSDALVTLFPELKGRLVREKFNEGAQTKPAFRNYFETFAKEKNFDPLVAKNWYSINKDDLQNARVRSLQFYPYLSNCFCR